MSLVPRFLLLVFGATPLGSATFYGSAADIGVPLGEGGSGQRTALIVLSVPGLGFRGRFWAGLGRNISGSKYGPELPGPGSLGPDFGPFELGQSGF